MFTPVSRHVYNTRALFPSMTSCKFKQNIPLTRHFTHFLEIETKIHGS